MSIGDQLLTQLTHRVAPDVDGAGEEELDQLGHQNDAAGVIVVARAADPLREANEDCCSQMGK